MLIEDNKYINWYFKKSWREAQKSICYTGMKQITEAKGKTKIIPQLGRCRRTAIFFGGAQIAHKTTIFRISMVIQRELICLAPLSSVRKQIIRGWYQGYDAAGRFPYKKKIPTLKFSLFETSHKTTLFYIIEVELMYHSFVIKYPPLSRSLA